MAGILVLVYRERHHGGHAVPGRGRLSTACRRLASCSLRRSFRSRAPLAQLLRGPSFRWWPRRRCLRWGSATSGRPCSDSFPSGYPGAGRSGLGLMGTVGMAVVGLVTSPLMGGIADRAAHEVLDEDEVVTVLVAAVVALESESGQRTRSRRRRPQVGPGAGHRGAAGIRRRERSTPRPRPQTRSAASSPRGPPPGGGAGTGYSRSGGEPRGTDFLPLCSSAERGSDRDLRPALPQGAAVRRLPRGASVVT